ncbi:MAG: 4Fe-4S single cluster domain [Actinotalea sp.]|nr:4Fe-4S single cluster domain [Actinotalea sp.]
MSYIVEIDADTCMCSRECVRVAPGAFIIDEDEMVARPTPAAASLEEAVVRRAVASCPVGAISARVVR